MATNWSEEHEKRKNAILERSGQIRTEQQEYKQADIFISEMAAALGYSPEGGAQSDETMQKWYGFLCAFADRCVEFGEWKERTGYKRMF